MCLQSHKFNSRTLKNFSNDFCCICETNSIIDKGQGMLDLFMVVLLLKIRFLNVDILASVLNNLALHILLGTASGISQTNLSCRPWLIELYAAIWFTSSLEI